MPTKPNCSTAFSIASSALVSSTVALESESIVIASATCSGLSIFWRFVTNCAANSPVSLVKPLGFVPRVKPVSE